MHPKTDDRLKDNRVRRRKPAREREREGEGREQNHFSFASKMSNNRLGGNTIHHCQRLRFSLTAFQTTLKSELSIASGCICFVVVLSFFRVPTELLSLQ